MGGLCPTTGKRQYASKGQARRGMNRLHASLGVYLCPHCHFHHLRNNDRVDNAVRPLGRMMGKKSKRKREKGQRRRVCGFCFEGALWAREKKQRPVPVAASYLEHSICSECLDFLRQGPRGRHKLISALEEAARIRALARREE